MNKFVDFGKRGVDLPAGCKDLIQVLQQAEERATPKLPTRSVWCLPDVATHVDRLTEAGGEGKSRVIIAHELSSIFLSNQKGVVTLLTVIHDSTQREQAVREVLEQVGLSPTFVKIPGAVSSRTLRCSFPAGASNIGKVVLELLRRGYGLAESVKLDIASWENDAS